METTSNECLSEIRALFSCRANVNAVRSFRGNEAQMFIDFLDRVLAWSCLDDKLRQRCLRLISKICKAHGIIPTSYILRHGLTSDGKIYCHSGFADVSQGKYFGCPVAIKRLKMNEGESDRVFRRLCREIIHWKHLSHPNILPLLGVSVSTDPHCFRILSEWMSNGNVTQYSISNPEANRLRLLSEAASGVTYLHKLGIVHGDLKGANILVDDRGTARIGDFGLMTVVDLGTIFLSESDASSGGTFCWMSPELLDPLRFSSGGRSTRESDCYAFGMVIYEVLTGLRPFHHLWAYLPVPAILKGERPEKPLDAESLGFSHTLWELVQSCWSESSSARPTARQLLDCLTPASLSWVPPTVYPVTRVDTPGATDSDSCGSWGISCCSSSCLLK